MKDIIKLFKLTDISEIQEQLSSIISEIDKADREEKDELLKEVVKEAKKANKRFRKKYKAMEELYIYPEDISPIALLAEEISSDSNYEKDMLKVLKFNLNNYFKNFKDSKESDWHVEIKDWYPILKALEVECEFFSMLKSKGITVSIFMLNARYKKSKLEIVNFDRVNNSNFAIHSFYCKESPVQETGEICLEQFGFLLNEVLTKGSLRTPNGFIDIFSNLDLDIDEDSKEATKMFANAFAHYIIEKMEIRISNEMGDDWNEHLDTRDDEFVQRLMDYFDNIFTELSKQNDEWDGNDFCPCRKRKEI